MRQSGKAFKAGRSDLQYWFWKKLGDEGQRLCDTQIIHQRALRKHYRGLPVLWQRLCRYIPRYLIARTSTQEEDSYRVARQSV
jgi:hypothetical protein